MTKPRTVNPSGHPGHERPAGFDYSTATCGECNRAVFRGDLNKKGVCSECSGEVAVAEQLGANETAGDLTNDATRGAGGTVVETK